VLTCASGEYVGRLGYSEAVLLSSGGGIGGVGFCTSGTHVPYNNIVLSGIWHGIFKLGLFNLGTATNYGRYDLWRQYAGFEDGNVSSFAQWANLMGDPATEWWSGVPQIVNVEHPEHLPLGCSSVPVEVFDADDNPLAGATVCLYKANDSFQEVGITDETGRVEFHIPPEALSAGQLLVTMTKHNIKPYLGTIAVEQAGHYLGAESWEVQNDDNGNGIANPGEAFTLSVTLKNFGDSSPDGSISVRGESLSPWARVEDDVVQLDQSPEPGGTEDVALTVHVDASAPNWEVIPIAVYASSDHEEFKSIVTLDVDAAKIIITDIHLPNNQLSPGNVVNLDLTIRNVGRQRIHPMNAHLWSDGAMVTVIGPDARYQGLNPNESNRVDGALFRIRAHPFTIPGTKATLRLAVVSDAGFRDTTTTIITVGRPEENDPFGPDKYGYVCFDSGDERWEMHPVYRWIEIDPNVNNRDFNGTLLNLNDNAEDADRSAVIDLPWGFQYYGRVFNRLTVCTNGWAAFGNWSELADFRNRRIASGEGPDAQLCVFWDDLTTGRILTYYDQNQGRFIIEWNNMHSQAGGATETFELILYDVRFTPTATGDGEIVFQYKEVSNPGGGGGSNDTPYATIGIGNLDDTDGLEYTYYNTYTRGAKTLQNQLAIKFTTSVQFITGILAGYVTDYATGAPIEGVEITTSRGFWSESDAEGRFRIDDILVGDYQTVTARKQGYNDSTWTGLNGHGYTIVQGDSVLVDIALLHPEFNVNINQFDFIMLNDSTTESGLVLSNDGNGTLTYTSRFVTPRGGRMETSFTGGGGPTREFRRDDPDERWDMLLSWNVSEALSNPRIQSIAWVEDHWLIAAGHQGQEEVNKFYEFDHDGAYTGVSFDEPVGGLYGVRDMHYTNGILFATNSDSSQILELNPFDGTIWNSWRTFRGFNNPRNITVDPSTGHIWTASITGRIYEMEIVDDTTLVEIHRFEKRDPRVEGSDIHLYGMSWFRDDPDGFNLYLLSNDEIVSDNQHPNIALFKMNPITGEIRYLTDFGFLPGSASARCGMDISAKWNNDVYVLAVILDDTNGDFAAVFELAPNSSWIDYSPRSDTLIAETQVPINFTIESSDLDTGRYEIEVEFHHNAGDGVTSIPVSLHVVNELPVGSLPSENTAPMEYSLAPVWPNPFNSRAVISYSLKRAGKARLEVFDSNGRLLRTLVNGDNAAGAHRVSFDGEGLPAGLYLYRLKVDGYIETRKMLLVR